MATTSGSFEISPHQARLSGRARGRRVLLVERGKVQQQGHRPRVHSPSELEVYQAPGLLVAVTSERGDFLAVTPTGRALLSDAKTAVGGVVAG